MLQEEQEKRWNALQNNINTLVSNLTRQNVKQTTIALLGTNIDRGRGVLCRAILRELLKRPQNASTLALLTCNIANFNNELGSLLMARLVALFKRGYTENNRNIVDATTLFLCELILLGTVMSLSIMELLHILLDGTVTDDSIRTAVSILYRLTAYMDGRDSRLINMVYDWLRNMLQEGNLLTTSQKRITELFQARRDGLRLNIDKSQIIDTEDASGGNYTPSFGAIQHPEMELDFFKVDDDYEQHEAEYHAWAKPILSQFEVAIHDDQASSETNEDTGLEVTDYTDFELIQTQKTIYLIMMSSMSADEGVHKLLKLQKSQKVENDVLLDMIIKCCAQEKTYSKYFGVVGEKLCSMSNKWHETFVRQFQDKYLKIYQYEGAQLRNIGKFFGHLLAADVLDPLNTLGCIVLTEKDTTSAGRVFIKFLFQALLEELGIAEVQKIVQDPELKLHIRGMFPVVDATYRDRDHLFFSINFFTAIGLGILTQEMRGVLENLPEEPRGRKRSRSNSSRSSSGSYSRSGSGSYSRSRSGSYSRSRSGSYSRSRSYLRSRLRSYLRLRSGSPGPGREVSHSRSPLRSPAN